MWNNKNNKYRKENLTDNLKYKIKMAKANQASKQLLSMSKTIIINKI